METTIGPLAVRANTTPGPMEALQRASLDSCFIG